MKITAIVPAAGTGIRMNHTLAKQYVKIEGIPIIARTLMQLQKFSLIDEIIIAVRKEEKQYCQREIINKYNISKVHKLVEGGRKRQISVYNALKEVDEYCELVVIHDSVRPFITEDILIETVAQANIYKAATTAISITDTVKRIDNKGFAQKTVTRKHLHAIQTPQVFDRKLILEAHKQAFEKGVEATDDSSLVERIGHSVKIVEGTRDNIKITTPEDLLIAEAISRELEI